MKTRTMMTFVSLSFALFALLVGGCGGDDPVTPPDSAVEETIGAAGGSLQMQGVAEMTVPAGAVASDVTFTMDDAGSSHAAMVGGRTLGSAVCTIGPAGTTFAEPVTLTLHYDEADLGGVAESTIVLYTDDGAGWTPLPTNVDEVANTASAQIHHLSDFAVTAPTSEAADGVFAVFEVARFANYAGEMQPNAHVDMIVARFDGVVNVCSIVEPMHPDSVWCSDFPMSWDDVARTYIDEHTINHDFLTLGQDYTFHVTASAEVPALEETVTMVEHEPVITNISDLDALSREGFTVEWNDTSDGEVTLTMVLSDEDVLRVDTANDGSHTFSAADLENLNLGQYFLALTHTEKRMLTDVPGYDPNSHIVSLTMSAHLVDLVDGSGSIGPEGGTVMLGDEGRLFIPAGALTEPTVFTAEIDATPPAGLEDYTLLSSVWEVGPAGTTFASDAEIELEYDESLLAGASEEDVVILTHDGTAWETLTTWVDTSDDEAEADIEHLSHFVAAVPTLEPTDGIYAVFETSRLFLDTGVGPMGRTDAVFARFDAEVDPDPVTPLQAASVVLDEWALIWDQGSYEYADFVDMDFLELGADYDLVVGESVDVPGATVPVSIPAAELYATNLDDPAEIPLSGFTLEWEGATLGGEVEITVIGQGLMGGLNFTTANDGSHEFSEADFESFEAGSGQVLIAWETETPVTADGYDDRCVVRHTYTYQAFVGFTSAGGGEQTRTWTSGQAVFIPDATRGGPGIAMPSPVVVDAAGTLSDIRVYIDLDHTYASDLIGKLMGPDGTEIKLFWICEGGEPNQNPTGWYPTDFTPKESLDAFLGKGTQGVWVLTFQDMSYDIAGTLQEWRVELTYTN